MSEGRQRGSQKTWLICWVHTELNTHSLSGQSSQSQCRRQTCKQLITRKTVKSTIHPNYYGERKHRQKQLSLPGKVGESFTKEKTTELARKRSFQGKV